MAPPLTGTSLIVHRRYPERLASVVEIVRCAYNFIRPHARLQLGRAARTPAMVAGIFDRVLSWRSVFAWPAPPPKPAAVLAHALPICGGAGSVKHRPSLVSWFDLIRVMVDVPFPARICPHLFGLLPGCIRGSDRS
jgi:hypothetical protein